MAEHLHLTIDDFAEKYLRQIGKRFSLRELPVTFDCVFFKDKQCSIYEVRPTQCRTYPFWKQNLASPQDWEKVAFECEGVRDHHPKVGKETIEKNLDGKP
jgi:Fe-S-cluster containining protein